MRASRAKENGMTNRSIAKMVLVVAALPAFFTPALPQTQPQGQQLSRTQGRKELIGLFVAAERELADLLEASTSATAAPDAKQKAAAALDRLVNIKTMLKNDRFENSPDVQALLKEKHIEIQDAAGRLAAQVSRIRALPQPDKDLLALLSKL